MPVGRYLLIAAQEKKDDILNVLKDYDHKKILSEIDGKIIFVYEGRGSEYIDETLTLSVDDEEDYGIEGDLELGSTFNAKVEIVVGYSIPMPGKEKLEKDANAKKLLNVLNSFGKILKEESDGYYNCEFVTCPGKKSETLMKNLKELASVCENLDIQHRITIFHGFWSGELGDLEDIGMWIGPSAYVTADLGEHEVIINSCEILFDGNSLVY